MNRVNFLSIFVFLFTVFSFSGSAIAQNPEDVRMQKCHANFCMAFIDQNKAIMTPTELAKALKNMCCDPTGRPMSSIEQCQKNKSLIDECGPKPDEKKGGHQSSSRNCP